MNWSHCGALFGNTKITDFEFADDAVMFAESLEALHGDAIDWLIGYKTIMAAQQLGLYAAG